MACDLSPGLSKASDFPSAYTRKHVQVFMVISSSSLVKASNSIIQVVLSYTHYVEQLFHTTSVELSHSTAGRQVVSQENLRH